MNHAQSHPHIPVASPENGSDKHFHLRLFIYIDKKNSRFAKSLPPLVAQHARHVQVSRGMPCTQEVPNLTLLTYIVLVHARSGMLIFGMRWMGLAGCERYVQVLHSAEPGCFDRHKI
jgi:hypothetical protein